MKNGTFFDIFRQIIKANFEQLGTKDRGRALRKTLSIIIIAVLLLSFSLPVQAQSQPTIKLGNEVLLGKYHHYIEGKRVGLITNQSGVDSKGRSLIDILAGDSSLKLTALYGPEHGIDGTASAGAYVASYTHPVLGIPVYSLYGATRMPTEEMLKDVDVLLFDIQDVGARYYTYISTLNYAMVAAQKYGKSIIVLDRPNPLGGVIVEGPVLEEPYQTFVGVDILPMAHGMTVGELARYFNRKIGADLKVVPMLGYTRKMIYQDTGLPWVQTSPNIPDIESVFGYMATGLGEGTGISQADKFKWIGGKNIDAARYAGLLNQAGLAGVTFIPEYMGDKGGVRLSITDYHLFNPARTGIYALAYAKSLSNFTVPKSGQSVVMFDKIMGSNKIGSYLEQGLTPQQIEGRYKAGLDQFKKERQNYLIYGDVPYTDEILVKVKGKAVTFDSPAYIDGKNRLMVPLRAIGEALGARVDWDAAARRVTFTVQDKTAQLTIDSTQALVNGVVVTMDTVPVIKKDRTMVPARFVSEFLGYRVDWDDQWRVVAVE